MAVQRVIDNPYSDIDWDAIHYLHSVSHQHARPYSTPWYQASRNEERIYGLYKQGIRHFAFSNRNPSGPVYPFYPLPEDILQKEDVISAPNAEHRSPLSFDMHYNTLGSYSVTGFGKAWQPDTLQSPYALTLEGDERYPLTTYDPDGDRESDGVYLLSILLSAREGVTAEPRASVTLTGAVERQDRTTMQPAGSVENWLIRGSDSKYILVKEESPQVLIDYDPETTRVDEIRLNSRTLIHWKQAFSEALDGDRVDGLGNPVEGLQFEDGGGITINHPSRDDYRDYLQLLDFDERVLGLEIWNHRRAFGSQGDPPHDRYFSHWDNILRTERQMYAFSVMDHRWLGRGRNVLLVPDPQGRTREQRKRDALRAYRNGQFFAVVGAIDTDEEGNLLETGDYTDFRFTMIELEKNDQGEPIAVKVKVEGNDASLRPNVQLRFITNRGMEKVANRTEARFELPHNSNGSVNRQYVRVEAMAFPDTHLQGEPLTSEMIEEMNVYDIAMLHDYRGVAGNYDYYDPGDDPIGIVDMVFAQAIRFEKENLDKTELIYPSSNQTVSTQSVFTWEELHNASE